MYKVELTDGTAIKIDETSYNMLLKGLVARGYRLKDIKDVWTDVHLSRKTYNAVVEEGTK